MVVIDFEQKKNDKRDQRLFMYATDDTLLNQVAAWAFTVKRVQKIPGANKDTKVCAIQNKTGKKFEITAETVRNRL